MPKLGGYIRGFIPKALITTNNNDEFVENRFSLRNAWNTKYLSLSNQKSFACTPFRAINNSGDLQSRQAYSCGGACQTPQSVPNVHGLKGRFGSIQSLCDGSDIPPAACNVRYVTDFSQYIRYQKLRAINKNYNDYSYGGDQSSASQSAIRAIRRY
jgi:hypothetical protein